MWRAYSVIVVCGTSVAYLLPYVIILVSMYRYFAFPKNHALFQDRTTHVIRKQPLPPMMSTSSHEPRPWKSHVILLSERAACGHHFTFSPSHSQRRQHRLTRQAPPPSQPTCEHVFVKRHQIKICVNMYRPNGTPKQWGKQTIIGNGSRTGWLRTETRLATLFILNLAHLISMWDPSYLTLEKPMVVNTSLIYWQTSTDQ